MKLSKLQEFIDKNKIDTKEQLHLIKDGVDLKYKVLLEDLDQRIMNNLITNNLDIKFVLNNSENSSSLYKKYYDKTNHPFVRDNEFVKMMFINKAKNDDIVYGKVNDNIIVFNKDIVNKIIEECEFDILDFQGGNILAWSAQEGEVEIFKKLLPYYKDLNSRDKIGCTALMYASREGHTEIVEILIEAGAEVNLRDVGGSTALMGASFEDHKEVVEILIEAGAELNVQDNGGSTALIHASYDGNEEVVEILIEAGAELDIQDNDGKTALIYASYNNNKDVAKLLIKAGANLDLKSNFGRTALMYASPHNNKEIFKLLIEAGAKQNVEDYEGYFF